MKKIKSLLCLLLVSCFAFAQSPQGINYQAVARNTVGAIISNQSIGVRISITASSNGTLPVYKETHTVTTNQFGLFTLNIGSGTPTLGTFSAIQWSSLTPYLKVEIDATGGTNYVLMGVSQLLSVPYSFYSNETMSVKRMTTLDRNGIASPTVGMLIYNTDNNCLEMYTGSGWTSFCTNGNYYNGVPTTACVNNWTQRVDFGGTARSTAVGFSIGTKGYITTGFPSQDFWEYDPSTNAWTQKANFGGAERNSAVGFSIGAKGYIGTGDIYAVGYTNDFWEYDPSINAWTQKTDFGGTVRILAVGFSIGTKGYVGTGMDGTFRKDFWEYDPVSDAWTQKSDFGGTAREGAVGFSIGAKGYVGTGFDVNGNYKKDFWEYNATVNTWTQKTDFGGAGRLGAVGFAIGAKGYIGTGNLGGVGAKDFWEYDPVADAWTQKTDFSGATDGAVGFVIGTKGFIGTGTLSGFSTKVFWEYCQ